ncbi:hypothetical protein EJB05_05199 [Eragrostis curvula]|uniref:Uncharacterized protein n=1 Tax=Eragrostis curvula TaxID=38414 RepID=A0A5J9SRH6_9POAL|nr:hypothetical protein EJB05_52988 [Eragrostis curvula]TVU45703.1 hypothetical protein EJB05_05199 [Eragrostis curvula]
MDGMMMSTAPSPAVSVPVERVPSPWRWPSALAINTCSLVAAFSIGAMAFTYVLKDHSPNSLESFFMEAALWFSAPHAAAAVLALLARRPEREVVLGLAAMLFAGLSHCMLAGFIVVATIVAHPRSAITIIFGVLDVLGLAVLDVVGFLSLFLGDKEEAEDIEACA